MVRDARCCFAAAMALAWKRRRRGRIGRMFLLGYVRYVPALNGLTSQVTFESNVSSAISDGTGRARQQAERETLIQAVRQPKCEKMVLFSPLLFSSSSDLEISPDAQKVRT